MLATVAATDSASTIREKYNIFIYSETESHAMYALYNQTRKLCVLQYLGCWCALPQQEVRMSRTAGTARTLSSTPGCWSQLKNTNNEKWWYVVHYHNTRDLTLVTWSKFILEAFICGLVVVFQFLSFHLSSEEIGENYAWVTYISWK